ncbi:hypothetical protein BU24DRAFT_398014 [Aaosphaeria arxii CBS 175.79]|uniref:ER transporter 6TM N-terminal domain-containing protein n=1 Tax=Aaosphaeria arxii CBS 175.79 TaxID=1450172 RepID=A0A6A5XEH3_9PLEO|nr:uncharacterized protein BU24DRAFT_398014 [Aaosphaeria arxii CBS 175.79]KAF2011468.1 hypothetical protein BU24DRAFT_398014 [Aaosphaeria arxii CBS 175.79]
MAATTAAGVNHVSTESNGATEMNEEAADVINGHARAATGSDDTAAPEKNVPKKQPSKLAQGWKKLGLDLPTVMMMMKAALPPTIAMAAYQANSFARIYTTLGYLVAVISILGFCIMPRAKFIQTMCLNVLGTCIGAAINLLSLWTGIKARENTTKADAPPQAYNSSQSAVLAVWLFFQIWLVNTMKSKFPQMVFPTIVYAIFAMVSATYGPQFRTMVQVESFMKRLLEAFLTAFAIATGVSLFIFPVTSRKVVKKEITAYIGALRGALSAHKTYLQSLETADVFNQIKPQYTNTPNKAKKAAPEVEAVKAITATFSQLHGKLSGDLPFAKREIAYGKLSPDDYEAISKHLRAIMLPLVGLGSLVDLFDRQAKMNNWESDDSDDVDPEQEAQRRTAVGNWNKTMKAAHEPFERIISGMDRGLHHVLLRLQLIPTPKKKAAKNTDEEAKGDLVEPGHEGFAALLEDQFNGFYKERETTLKRWVESRGIAVGPDFFHSSEASEPDLELLKREPTLLHQSNQRQLYLLLYIIYLLYAISRAVMDFVKFADERDQAKAKKHLINPGKKRLRKWLVSIFRTQDSNNEDETTAAGLERNSNIVYMGEAYKRRKDPEHLPPANAWEKFGNAVRTIPAFLRSPDSAFGFRCACATMCIAVTAYLHDSARFFIEQRLVWAMIMVAISMTPTAGQSVASFFLRIVGTIIAMILAWLTWYIPGQHTAGILVFLWVFVGLGFYVILKRMDLIIAGIISVVTITLIVGYELEVRKIGRALAESNGQPYYEIYKLGPYRLATVLGGLFVAFIWTFFPYPISEHSALRQKLGGSLYLSANYYSIVHETVMARIRGDEGDVADPTSPGFLLNKARNKVFSKQMLLLQGLRQHSEFVRWEFPLGGKFPIKDYNNIIRLVSNIVNYTSLISYASTSFTNPCIIRPTEDDDPSRTQWFRDFRRIITSAKLTSHEITSMLSLLSSSITNGQPLPPYLQAPQSYQLSHRLEATDSEVLSLRHIAEPGYSAFAVLQISTSCINQDLEQLLRAVKKLVGELDFSFHVTSTTMPSPSTSSDTLMQKSSNSRSKQD